MPLILYISNDGARGDRFRQALGGSDFAVCAITNLYDAAETIRNLQPDLVVIACSRPDEKTRRFCAGLREVSHLPIVVCSASSLESDIVAVFDAGADDCLLMPVRPVELAARLRAVLRRTADARRATPPTQTLMAGDIEIRLNEHKAYRKGRLIDLSPTEFRLLAVLAREVGRAVSHSRLIASAWGPEYVDCRHYLRLYIKYLRLKIEDNPRDPRVIVSEWGVGYRLEPAAAA